MRSDEMAEKVRLDCSLPSEAAAPSYSNKRIYSELTDKCRTLFGDRVMKAAAGYWQQFEEFNTVAGQAAYRLPPRALMSTIIGIERQETNRWVPVSLQDFRDLTDRSSLGTPSDYQTHGGFIRLSPVPDGVYTLRFIFYISPSTIVQSQCSALGGDGVERGRVTAVDPDSREISVNAIPYDQLLVPPGIISVSAGQRIDVINPCGWHDLTAYSLPITAISGTQLTIGGTKSLANIQIGDYVRAENQSDWAPLPAEGSRILVDAASRKILATWVDDQQKSKALEDVLVGDLSRFFNSLTPRVQTQPKRVPVYFRCK